MSVNEQTSIYSQQNGSCLYSREINLLFHYDVVASKTLSIIQDFFSPEMKLNINEPKHNKEFLGNSLKGTGKMEVKRKIPRQ